MPQTMEERRADLELDKKIAALEKVEDLCEMREKLWHVDGADIPDEVWSPTHDYNIIIPIIQKMSDNGMYNFFMALPHDRVQFTYQIFKHTPRELCEAYIKVRG